MKEAKYGVVVMRSAEMKTASENAVAGIRSFAEYREAVEFAKNVYEGSKKDLTPLIMTSEAAETYWYAGLN